MVSDESIRASSLCPVGWRLPVGGTKDNEENNDVWSLVVDGLNDGVKPEDYDETVRPSYHSGSAEGIAISKLVRKYPNNFILAGYEDGESELHKGNVAGYWTSTVANYDYVNRLSFNDRGLSPGTSYGYKYLGRSVRCVTASVARQNVTVNFDEGVESVTLHSDDFGDKIVTTSGTVVALAENSAYTITGVYDADYDFERWIAAENGTLGSATSAETTYTVSGTTSLTLYSKKICSQGHICYDKNNRDAGAPGGKMGNQTVSGTSAILWASNYGREGYGFAGWNTEADGTGTNYGPNETIVFDSTDEDGLMLYAMWVASAGSLQDWSCPSNTSMPIGTITALTDERDSNTYAIAKLADGKCWMIENMRIDNDATTGAENKALAEGYVKGFVGLAEPETDNFADSTTANSLYTTDTSSTTLNIITGNNLGSRFPRYNNDNTSNAVAKMNGEDERVYSYGNYYTYAAAIADIRDHTIRDDYTVASICPSGWRLPAGGTRGANNDYWALVVDELNGGVLPTGSGGGVYDGDTAIEVSKAVRKYPNNFVNSGDIERGAVAYGKGGRGDYWTSSTTTSDGAFRFSFRYGGVNPGVVAQSKYYGMAVRCVSEYTYIEGYEYMQDLAELTVSEMDALKASMVEGKQYTMKDGRDEKKYYISKLADGNIWMTQDLDHDIVTTTDFYTYDNTDIGHGSVVDTNAIWTASMATYETGDTTWDTSHNGDFIPQSYDPGDVVWDGITDVAWSITLDNMEQGTNPHYRIGNYYSWTAALAMNDSSSIYTDGTVVEQSICPAGWTLPEGGEDAGSGSFLDVAKHYGFVEGVYTMNDPYAWETPLYYSFGGLWRGYSDLVASFAYYWSSTTYSSYVARNMSVDPDGTSIAPYASYDRYDGFPVRCVARTPVETHASIDNLDYMQDFASLTEEEKEEVLDSMIEGEQYVLKDSRDNKKYYISKLADGNIWMTQNLDFDIVNGGADINSSNTNVPDGWSDAGNLTDTYASDDMSWNRYLTAPESYDVGDLCWQGSISTENHNDSAPCADSLQNQANHSHVGNYYNWTAAVAMSDSSSYTDEGIDVKQSICPAGWILPKGGTELRANSFANLVNQYNLTSGEFGNAHQTPTYLAYSGAWEGEGANSLGIGGVGMYHSSTVVSAYATSRLSLSASNNGAVANDSFYRGTAYSVRCVVGSSGNPKNFDDLAYMQDFADLTATERAEVLDSMTLEQQYQLTDSRDGKVYYIAKLADGNVWMTQNLDLDLDANTTYTPADTDIPDDWTPMRTTHAANDSTWVEDKYTPESRDVGNLCWTGVFNPELEVDPDDLVVDCTNGNMHYHIGNYYNWTAAVAMNDSSSHIADYDDVNQSICPAGWMLPKNSYAYMEDSIYELGEAYSLSSGESGNAHLAPVYFTYSGSRSEFPGSVGVSGDYWSSVVYNLNASYDSFTSANGDDLFSPFDSMFRYHGSSVRCLARH